MPTLDKPVALITGAAGGIGRHFALASRIQFRWVATDIQEGELQAVFGPETESLLPLKLDVSDAENWKAASGLSWLLYRRLYRKGLKNAQKLKQQNR